MDVDAAEARNVQHALRQDLPIGDHGDDVRLQRPQLLHNGIVAEGRRLINRQSRLECAELRIGHDELHAAVLRHIRLGIDADHIKVLRDQAL